MTGISALRAATRWGTAALGLAAVGYGTYVGLTWARYGHPRRARPDDRDDLLDRFMPVYDVVERHRIRVSARPAVTLAAARDMELASVPLIRAIFKGRELIMGASPGGDARPQGLLDEMRALGWVVLAERPDQEIVVGSVTKPWEADVVFRSIPPDAFAAFDEPGYVRIAWTLRADPMGPTSSMFRTETRAVATDADARRRFRVYWACLSPGILLIRRLMLRPLRRAAEREAAAAALGRA